jgi:uracil-DNA glycosylase
MKLTVNQCEGCQKCKLHEADHTWRPSAEFNGDAKYLFILEQYNATAVGRLRRLLKSCEFDVSDIEVAFLTRCNAGDAVKAQIREAQHCLVNFESLLESVSKDTLLVPMGSTCCKLIAKKSIQTGHGTIGEVYGRICVPTLHPGQVVAYPDSLPNFVADLGKIVDARNGDIVPAAKVNYTIVDTIEKFDAMIAVLSKAKAFSFDI